MVGDVKKFVAQGGDSVSTLKPLKRARADALDKEEASETTQEMADEDDEEGPTPAKAKVTGCC